MRISDCENVRSVILEHFTDANAARDAINRYFDADITGPMFDRLADAGQPDYFTANDIVAVSMLAVEVPPPVAGWLLLGEGRAKTHELLRQVPTDLDTWDANEHIAPSSPLWQLWDILMGCKDVGRANCSKLLAAKRPRLVPIQDSVVNGLFKPHDDFWKAMAYTLSRPEDRARIAAATDNAPPEVSLLRRIDVALWMLNRSGRI